MNRLDELLKTGLYDTYTPTKRMTVRELIDELGLKMNYFGILVDDKKADIDTVITPESKVVIIPRIAGGSYEIYKLCPLLKDTCRAICAFFKEEEWSVLSMNKIFTEARCYLSSKQGIVIYKRDKPYKIEDEEPEGIGSLF